MEKTEIRFRPMNEEDLGQIAIWFEDFEDVAMFDRGLPIPVGKGFVSESWKSALQYDDPPRAFWFIVETNDAEPIGLCGIQSINYIHGDAIVPLFVRKEYRNKGLALSMMLMLIDLAFNQLRLHRISTVYHVNNKASEKLISLAGFAKEGTIREGWYSDGQHHDIIQVGLLESEWLEKREVITERLSASPFTW